MPHQTMTPESYNTRVQADFREFCQAELDDVAYRIPDRTPEEVAGRRIYGVERAAVTLLAKNSALHSCVREWVERIAADPHYVGGIERTSESGDSVGDDIGRYTLVYAAGKHPIERLEKKRDQAVYYLASDVVHHRLHGEDGADNTTDLGAGITVTTDLAASVVEFTMALINAWGADAVDMMDQRDALQAKLDKLKPEA